MVENVVKLFIYFDSPPPIFLDDVHSIGRGNGYAEIGVPIRCWFKSSRRPSNFRRFI